MSWNVAMYGDIVEKLPKFRSLEIQKMENDNDWRMFQKISAYIFAQKYHHNSYYLQCTAWNKR